MYGNFIQILDTLCINYILSNIQVNVLPRKKYETVMGLL